MILTCFSHTVLLIYYFIIKYSKKWNFRSIKWYAISLSSAFIMEKRDKSIMYPFKYPVYVLIVILEILLEKKWLSRESCTLYKPNKCLQNKISQRKYTNTKICFCYCCCLVAKSCLTLSWPHDCSPNRPSVRVISQAKTLEWVAISFSRGSSQPRGWTYVYCIGRRILYHWAIKEAQNINITICFPILLKCLSSFKKSLTI